jgi:phage head maturation protease
MDKQILRKTFDLKALDVDKSTRQVKIAIAELESIDRDKEVFDPLAFDKSIAERGPKGSNEIWHMTDHGSDSMFGTPSLEKALSKFKELGRDGKYISGLSEYKNTWLWREVAWPLYESGDITQHSVGFQVIGEKEAKGNYSIIKEVALWEGSAVLWGANPNTPTQEVVKSLIKNKKENAADRLAWIIKAMKEGKYSGENESLLILELKQLESLYTFQEPSQKDTPAIEPEDKPLIEISEKDTLLIELITKNFNGI